MSIDLGSSLSDSCNIILSILQVAEVWKHEFILPVYNLYNIRVYTLIHRPCNLFIGLCDCPELFPELLEQPTFFLVLAPAVRVDLLVGCATLAVGMILSNWTWEDPIIWRLELPWGKLKHVLRLVPAKLAGDLGSFITAGSWARWWPMSDICKSTLIHTKTTYYHLSSSSFASSRHSTCVR